MSQNDILKRTLTYNPQNESFEPGSVPTTGLAPNITFLGATNIWKTANLASAVIIIFLLLSPYIGHPAWILPTVSTSTANFTIPLTEDISHVHTTFRETVVPFKSRWEFDDLLKVLPSSLFRVLYDELNDIEMGLDSWRKASLPASSQTL
ncbi:hypothetical protein FIE12Z_11726 [Fusarium flagelliforme]|uniref:Uncharacterized protein n=1 Tax=Fusarium flagelliforme TaxID=2675880 RepID=A0A395M821_9HYPO|nr:hypothetical protein FIE12Z_11726 [Fusarium flagelliforme]